jgi:CRISPR-associated protein Cas4
LGICGKIDIYEPKEKLLIERKHKIVQVYQGQIYQLWGQYFCMLEMGYAIEQIELYSISTNQHFPVAIPNEADKVVFIGFINEFKYFNPSQNIPINYNKCRHCIYCNLCDKVEIENVYS